MPTKGASRAHEAIMLAPARTAPPASDSFVPEPTPDEIDGPLAGVPIGGTWIEDAPLTVDDIPDELSDEPTEDEPDPDQDAGAPADRTALRTYRGELTEVEMHHVTGARQATDEHGAFTTPVTVHLNDGVEVEGTVELTPGTRWRRQQYNVNGDGRLSCSCGEDPCEHRGQAVEAVRSLMEARRIRSGVADWEQTQVRAGGPLAEAYRASVQARSFDRRPEPDGPAWSTTVDSFQEAYTEARARKAAGEAPVPFVTENATGGLGARDGGRPFGVEIEFDLQGVPDRAEALRAIGRDLHAAGITPHAHQTNYHSGRAGFNQWRFERDSTVDGEIVSPILYDEPESWNKIAKVCKIVARHGGKATSRTGGHVHVGVGDYDHTVENHNNLLGMFRENEDTLYRLAQNPARQAHRGTSWCSPNRIPTQGYNDVSVVQRTHGNHSVGLNFQSVSGRQTDHVEFRMWDGSLDPGTIQTQVKLSLGMTEAAFRTPSGTQHGAEPIGTHRRANSHLQRGQRLSGEAWEADTKGFRGLMDRLFTRDADKRQAAALFGATKWQRSGR